MASEARNVLVTGANRGIGLELVRQLSARGDRVFAGARSLDKAEQAAASAAGSGTVTPVLLDVTSDADADAAAARIGAEVDRLDVLINNAAIHYDTQQRAADADLGIVREALETNLIGAWRVTLAMLPLLRRGEHARIVNVSSGAGSLAEMSSGTPAYRVSKAALNAFTRTLAADLEGEALVNAVCPGWVATEMGGSGGRPVAEGTASVLFAADLDDDGPSGGFFRDGRPIEF